MVRMIDWRRLQAPDQAEATETQIAASLDDAGLAVAQGGKLATLDRSIPLKAVVGAVPHHLELIGSAGD